MIPNYQFIFNLAKYLFYDEWQKPAYKATNFLLTSRALSTQPTSGSSERTGTFPFPFHEWQWLCLVSLDKRSTRMARRGNPNNTPVKWDPSIREMFPSTDLDCCC